MMVEGGAINVKILLVWMVIVEKRTSDG